MGDLIDPKLTPSLSRAHADRDRLLPLILSNPDVSVSLAGPRDGRELDDAMAALDKGPMSEDELAWMRRVGVAVRRDASREGAHVAILDRLQARLRRSA